MSFRRRLMMGQRGGSIGYYTIDQTGTYSDPSDMIRDREVAGIQAIRNASHLYVGELVNGVLQCKQVSDTDKTKYADGTSVVLDGNKDMFMKLPQFWWKSENVDNNADKVKISFSITQENEWHEWAGNVFIGTYAGYVENNKLFSRNGVNRTTSISYNNSKTYASNKGAGYRLYTYEAHNIIALLAFGYYGSTSVYDIVGHGQGGGLGACDSFGMNDTAAAESDVLNASNMWGIETYYYNAWIDNIKTVGAKVVKICDTNGNELRRVSGVSNTSGDKTVKKMLLGNYADLLPKEQLSTLVYDVYYATMSTITQTANRIGRVGWFNLCGKQVASQPTETLGSTGARLLYEGSYNIID